MVASTKQSTPAVSTRRRKSRVIVTALLVLCGALLFGLGFLVNSFATHTVSARTLFRGTVVSFSGNSTGCVQPDQGGHAVCGVYSELLQGTTRHPGQHVQVVNEHVTVRIHGSFDQKLMYPVP